MTHMKFRIALTGIALFILPALPGYAQSPEMKQPVQGLVDMQDIGFYRKGIPASFTLANVEKYPGQFGGIVLNATWAQLQPAPPSPASGASGHFQLQTGYIDSALKQVRDYNSTHPKRPLGVKLRVWGGFAAPQWAKDLSGGPVRIPVTVHGKSSELLGRYWMTSYRQAWQALQAALARKYDRNRLIREVAVTSCAWATDEPFVQWIGPADHIIGRNFINLRKAGYSAKQEIKCLSSAIADYASWKTTYLDFPFNPLQMYLPEAEADKAKRCQHIKYGKLRYCNSEGPAKAIMLKCARSGKCILSNHALTGNEPASAFPYGFINHLHTNNPAVKVDFQTASPARVTGPGGFCAVVTQARKYHASSVELWPAGGRKHGFTSLTLAQITGLANVMNGTGKCATSR